jgi:hypothetical protein
MSVTPWWQSLEIRGEISNSSGQIEDVQMSLGAAVFPPEGMPGPLYADPANYGQITHPTRRLTALLADIAIRLAGGADGYTKAGALIRLNQGMGGGKSHAEIGAWHLAAHPGPFLSTDIGQTVAKAATDKLGKSLPSDLNNPIVVVLDLDNGTPGIRREDVDGPYAKTLYEKFLWRLFGGNADQFTTFRPHWQDKAKIKEALAVQGRPVLIVIDEIMDYIGNGLTGAGDQQLASQDMAFLRALLDSVNDVPFVAMLVAMIDPEKDRISLSDDGKERQKDLHQLLERNGRPASVNEDTDFTAILRRRLFVAPPTESIALETAHAFTSVMKDPGWSKVFSALNADWATDWDRAVTRSFPFHPQLMHLAEQEWAKNSGYQNVRSTIRVFAATVYALQKRAQEAGWAPLLIGPGDLPLWNNEVREALLGSGLISDISLEANYRSIIQGDITNLADSSDASGQSRALDKTVTSKEHWGQANPHAHERAATMIAVASLMPRGAGRRGASEPEIKVASALPNITYSVGDADGVISRLTDINSESSMASAEPIEGKGGQPRRYYLNPETGAKVVYRQHRQSVTNQDRDDVIADTVRDLTTTGPFSRTLFVDADRSLPSDSERRDLATETLLNAGIDDARSNRLVILDPSGFSLRNGMSEASLAAVNAVSGIGEQSATVAWASSAVYAVVNTQRRRAAREAAAESLAWQRTYNSPELASNQSARDTARQNMREAQEALKRNLRRAYQHILFLAQLSPDSPRRIVEVTLENDAETALNGTTVWKELAEKGKVFQTGQFSAKALLTNLNDTDYGRPLSELRDAFYQTPRLPLLPGGDNDLKSAIYFAVKARDLRLVGADGVEKIVEAPDTINLSSQGLRLAKPLPAEPCTTCGKSDCDGSCATQKACSKCGKSDCDGTCPCPQCGKIGCDGTCAELPVTKQEVQVKFTVVTEVSEANRGATVSLVESLFSGLVDGQISFLSGTVQLVTTTKNAEEIRTAAQVLGVVLTVKPTN